jgi:hypothetical protein
MGLFTREPKPIRQLRLQLEAIPMMWTVHLRMPAAQQQHAVSTTFKEVRMHVRDAVTQGHGALARQVLDGARRNPPAGPAPDGLAWDAILDAARSELPA